MSTPSAVSNQPLDAVVWPEEAPSAASMGRDRSATYLALLLLFVIVIFWKVALTRQYTIMAWSDSAGQTYSWSQYIATTLHHHGFPFWDPFTDGGRPFIGEAQTAVFYPFNLAMAALPLNRQGLLPASYITAFVLLHCFLASLFTYLLARRFGLSRFSSFVAAVAYTYSGSVARRSFAQINIFYGTVWIPAVFLFYFEALAARVPAKRLALANLGGLCLAFTFLAGHHQPPLYCGIALAFTALVLWFWQKPDEKTPGMNFPRRITLSVTLLVFLFAGLYSAPQLIPSFEYSSRALRWMDVGENQQPVVGNATVPYSIAGKFILHPRDLTLLLFPNATPVDNPPYLGILPLFFLLLSVVLLPRSRAVRWCWLVLLLFVALSLGSYSPLHGLFYVLVPFYHAARAAQRNLVMAHLAGAFLAGFGCNALLNSLRTSVVPAGTRALWSRPVHWLQGTAVVVTVVVSAMYLFKIPVAGTPGYDDLFFACLLLLASSSLLWLRGHGLVGQRTMLVGLVVILLFDYHGFLSPYIQPKSGFDRTTNFEPTHYYADDDLLRFLRPRLGNARVEFRPPYYPNMIGDVYRFETTSGTEASRLKSMVDLGTGEQVENLLGVKYIVSSRQLALPEAFVSGNSKVYENPGALPRAWLVSRLIPGYTSSSAAERMQQPGFDPRAQALLEEPAERLQPELSGIGSTPSDSPGTAEFQWHGPNHFTVSVESERRAFLVVSETSYPGWRAVLNGKPQHIFRADGTLMGLLVPPGPNVIDFVFRPAHLFLGLALVVFAGTFLAGALWISHMGHPADTAPLRR